MSKKRPRRRPTPQERVKVQYQVDDEFTNCHTPGCKSVISILGYPRGYSGPVHCSLHVDRVKAK